MNEPKCITYKNKYNAKRDKNYKKIAKERRIIYRLVFLKHNFEALKPTPKRITNALNMVVRGVNEILKDHVMLLGLKLR